MQSTHNFLDKATQVIMSDDLQPNAIPVEGNFFHSDTDLEVDRHYCAEDARVEEDFIGDHEDYELLSKDAPKTNQRKTKISDVKVGCNTSTEENYLQLENERNYLKQKFLVPCEKETTQSISYEDLFELKFVNECEIMQAFLKS